MEGAVPALVLLLFVLRPLLRLIARRGLLIAALLIGGIFTVANTEGRENAIVGLSGLACVALGLLAAFVRLLTFLGPLGSLLLFILVGDAFEIDAGGPDGGADSPDPDIDGDHGPEVEASAVDQIAESGSGVFPLPANVVQDVLGAGALGPMPGPEGFAAPSEIDGDLRTLPVRGHWRMIDGALRWIDPYWRGTPN